MNPNEIINISVCLTDIPKELIATTQSGKKYINFTISNRKEADKYQNTLNVSINKTKEQKEQNPDKVYVGSGKVFTFQRDDNPFN